MDTTREEPPSYDDLYASEAVFNGDIQYVNMGLHPVDTQSLGNPKKHDLLQPHQQQLYLALLTLPRVLHLLERAASENRSVQVLDVGCGTGASLQLIQRVLGARAPSASIVVCGVDKSRVAVKQHKRLFHNHHDKNHRGVLHYDVELQRMSAFARHRFDIVVGVQSFQEMKTNPDAAIAEVARVLKPQGLLLVADFYSKHQPFELSFLSHVRSHPSFDLHFEQDVSHAATIAAKQTSAKTVETMNPRDVASFASLLTLKKSPMYEAVRLGSLQFGLFGWHSVVDPEVEDDVINRQRDDDHVIDDEAAHDHGYDDDDIDDAMNQSYFDYKTLFPELELLKQHVAVIQAEAAAAQLVASWPNWPEDHYVGDDGEWRVFPLCYTFPAWDATKTVWVDATCAQCPKTVALLKQLPNLRTALFSNLGPNTHLGAHRGWADLANDILRVHLGLDVPVLPATSDAAAPGAGVPGSDDGEPSDCCCVVVAGEARAHSNGELLVFDDSKLHYAYNKHPTANRCVLIVDMMRPEHVPKGKAVGGHTDELDRFIEQYNASLSQDAS